MGRIFNIISYRNIIQPSPRDIIEGHSNIPGQNISFRINKSSQWSSDGNLITVQVDDTGYWRWDNPDDIQITSLRYAFSSYSSGSIGNIRDITFLPGIKKYTSGLESVEGMFEGNSGINSIEGLSNIDFSSVTSARNMFYNVSGQLRTIDLSGISMDICTSLEGMFNGCWALQSINIKNLYCPLVATTYTMFAGCQNLTSIIGSEEFNPTRVTNASYMFNNCKSLVNIDLSGWDTPVLSSISFMFYSCDVLTELRIDNMYTKNVTSSSLFTLFVPDKYGLSIYYKMRNFNTSIVDRFGYADWINVG